MKPLHPTKGPVTPPPRNEKRENYRRIKNQQRAEFIYRNEKIDDFLPPRKTLTNQGEVQ